MALDIKTASKEALEKRFSEIAKQVQKAKSENTAIENSIELNKEAKAIENRLSEIELEERTAKRAKFQEDTAFAQIVTGGAQIAKNASDEEAVAKSFMQTKNMKIDASTVKSVLVSSGDIATPTAVSGINDIVGSRVSSIVDLVRVVNCEGMGKNRVSLVNTEAEAKTQTEGQAVSNTGSGFKFVDITPESIETIDYISKQAQKQTPLQYKAKVEELAYKALRRKAAEIITSAINASAYTTVVPAKLASGKGVIDETTLRTLALGYGGDDSVVGGAVLQLNKNDLIAFGDVRGSDKKPVYEITPDGSNPNMGTIKDGGLTVRYCINPNITACNGTSQSTESAIKTMIYGDPMCAELDLFSPYEINVSKDHAIDKLLHTIVGDAEVGAGVIAKNGFAILTIAKGNE